MDKATKEAVNEMLKRGYGISKDVTTTIIKDPCKPEPPNDETNLNNKLF